MPVTPPGTPAHERRDHAVGPDTNACAGLSIGIASNSCFSRACSSRGRNRCSRCGIPGVSGTVVSRPSS